MTELIYATNKSCSICNASSLEEILHLGDQPPANSLYKPSDQAPLNVPLRLMFCKDCSTVQLGETVDPTYLFDRYVWVTGTSKVAKDHSKYFLEQTLSRTHIENPRVIEIASNDGTFIEQFKNIGCDVLGIDPATNIAKQASADGIPTMAEYFNDALANKILLDHGATDLIFARNVIPHVKEIHSVIAGIATLLKDDGLGIIEFHNAGLIKEELHYDSIYHEHLFYFSLKTISTLLNKNGLHVFDIITSPISGGSWIIFFSKNSRPISDAVYKVASREEQSGLNTISAWKQFAEDSKRHSSLLKKMVYDKDNKIHAYGASARSSTLLNFCQIDNRHIKYIIDKNPLKHQLLSPGSAIPIISFEKGIDDMKDTDTILLLAWNFEKEIISALRTNGFKGEFIVPLPNSPRVV